MSGKGGKKRKSKDAGAHVCNQQTETPVASPVTTSAPRSETSTTVGTIDAIECTSLSMWTLELVELCGRWMRTSHVRKFQVQQVAIDR